MLRAKDFSAGRWCRRLYESGHRWRILRAGHQLRFADGHATFPATGTGSTSQTITIGVCGDTVVEPNEPFFVELSGETNAPRAVSSKGRQRLDWRLYPWQQEHPGKLAHRLARIGPSLSQFGLKNVLADPTLELHDANGAILAANDNWTHDPVSAAQLTANGLGLSNQKESGIFTSLPAGQFTAILAGKNGGVGLGLVEIYNLK